MMSPKEVMELVVKTLDDRKGKNISALKTEKVTVLADYFVICTGTSTTHVNSLAEEVDKKLSEADEAPLRREGYRSGGWVLLDFGCVVVHIFLEEMREFYGLERLWSDAAPVDISALAQPD